MYFTIFQSHLFMPEDMVGIAMFCIPSLVASTLKLWIAWRMSLYCGLWKNCDLVIKWNKVLSLCDMYVTLPTSSLVVGNFNLMSVYMLESVLTISLLIFKSAEMLCEIFGRHQYVSFEFSYVNKFCRYWFRNVVYWTVIICVYL